MSEQLSVDFCGINLKNPFLLASTPASRGDRWKRAAKAGWAGGVTWGGQYIHETAPLVRLYSAGGFIDKRDDNPSWCCQLATCLPPPVTHSQARTQLKILDRCVREAKKSGLPVLANILESGDVDLFVTASKVAEAAGADMLELNLSCPIPPLGLYFSCDLPLNAEIVKSVRRAVKIPIMAKLHMWLLPEELKAQAKTVVEAGADAISVSNILNGFVGLDIHTGLPWASYIDNQGELRATASPMSGPAIKPLGLRAVAEVASVVDVPISGIGGIANWRDAVEYIMAGCTTVQVGMAAMLFGYSMVKGLIYGLRDFMAAEGYERVTDFVGLTRSKVVGFGDPALPTALDLKHRMVVDESLCDGCGDCVECCIATANGAAKLRRGIAYIQQEKCIQCNACMLICPQRAIKTVPV